MRSKKRTVLYHAALFIALLSLLAIFLLARFRPSIGLSDKGIFIIITLFVIWLFALAAAVGLGRTKCVSCRRIIFLRGHTFSFCPYCGAPLDKESDGREGRSSPPADEQEGESDEESS